ncbi:MULTISPECIES: NAD(P)H-dependent oxidoreductase [Chryseobacterium]|uniref:Modulator of drug activity B n=1 Tax=Chryseobacterium rhizosphaerae TaxID=395937 RepID=A0AAE3YAI6_9FLAO|nr:MULTISPECIES: NAD(P)H-dependent oxidoreductase [Chryseobacterium]MDC8101397.1 NAD(P)H-dependent oxidoreductase [Chryseobacterium rhizosphaerae]MDR6528024.1 modulator of drug activity B [Chryseobacterium rhizosphaerae]REC73701.1 NADPH quinone reductase MdaB [Chryseobacterium rhizosphaerae]SMC82220.1 modulator of drug activity B [Chryseobacterium sp. YR221]GEN69250.1 NADPH quinone reductase MdaB [Chryseobacterium rhizosphaerae]
MKKVLIINGGQNFGHSGGKYNDTIAENTLEVLKSFDNIEVQITNVSEGYDKHEEVKKFVWADYIIYHTPIWWFQLPNGLKKYIDEVFTAGHAKGIYMSDGRNAENPQINYGTGGMLGGRKYMLTTSWNAPATAFTLPGEFFSEKSVDEGPLFGFHRMNAFVSLKKMESFHFHDVEKNANIERDMKLYRAHVKNVFEQELKPQLA